MKTLNVPAVRNVGVDNLDGLWNDVLGSDHIDRHGRGEVVTRRVDNQLETD